MATGSSDGPSEVARIFLVTNISPVYATERGLRNCFRQYCGQEGPQVEYSNVKSPDNNTDAALVTVEGLSSEGAHDALQQKMLLGGRILSVSHVCSELVTLQFGDIDGHLSQTMQKIAGRMGLHCTVRRKEVCISGPFDLVQQFRMDLRAEVFLTAQCSSFTSVMSAASQSVPSVLAASKKAPQISVDEFDDTQGMRSRSMTTKTDELPLERQKAVDISVAQSPFSNQKTLENDTHMVIDNLSPDVLQLLDKIPEGDISGVQYNPSLGTVTVQGLNKADVEETTAKFEEVYENIVEKFQVDIVPLDKDEDISTLLSLVNELNHQYVHCAFIHSEDTQMVKIISNSTEQMEQAKKQLLEQLNQTTPTPGPVKGKAAGKRSVEEFSTKLKSGHTITIRKGDITKESASVLVTMINDRFQSVGDMSAAVNAASRGNVQQRVQEYTKKNTLVSVGDLIVTRGGGELKCKNVYNIVCPDLPNSIDPEDMGVTINGLVTKVLSEAERQKARTVVMPSFVSTLFVDLEMVARAVTEAIFDYCYHYHSSHKHPMVSNVTVVVGDEATYSCFVRNVNQSKSGNKSTEGQGRAAEVKAMDNGAGHHPSLPVTVHKAVDSGAIHPVTAYVQSNPTSGGGEYIPKMDTTPIKPSSDPPIVTNITTSPAISPKLPQKRDQVPASTPMVHTSSSDILQMMDENCPVCGGPFTTPTAGRCEHAFCSRCLEQAAQEETLLCPVCKNKLEGIQPPVCPLCADDKKVVEPVTTVCCRQIFCRECLTKHLKLYNKCPSCNHSFGSAAKTQPQPSGNMSFTCLSSPLPGYAGCDTIQITYDVPNGIDANGQPYLGASRVAYLPDNIEGRDILKLLQKAWNKELIYYVGPKSEVVWTDIPHKINTTGGQLNRGYPDQQYFYNVRQSLASKGIVP